MPSRFSTVVKLKTYVGIILGKDFLQVDLSRLVGMTLKTPENKKSNVDGASRDLGILT
jgi:hypothetical protein